MFTSADNVSLSLFCLLLLAVVFTFLLGIHKLGKSPFESRRRVIKNLSWMLAWYVFLSVLVYSGFIEEMPMPRLPLFMFIINIAGIGFSLSPEGKELSQITPLSYLILFQAFRLPLELILQSWAQQGVIPETMTWTGQNFDIISGTVCLILGILVHKNIYSRALAWTANIIGFALLINVMRVAIMSSPLPFAWQVSPPLTLAFHIPYFLILPICVSGALTGHIILTRALLRK